MPSSFGSAPSVRNQAIAGFLRRFPPNPQTADLETTSSYLPLEPKHGKDPIALYSFVPTPPARQQKLSQMSNPITQIYMLN